MRSYVFFFALVMGCGGSSASDLFGGDPNGSSGSSPGAGASGSGTEPPPPSSTSEPAPCTPTTYYKDEDGDGVGGTKTQSSCTPPGKDWVTKGGDCNDRNENVFPGQTEYFSTPYDQGGAPSFDYDCSGAEEQKPPPRKAATTCTVNAQGNGCTGDGYIPADGRTNGAGIDPLCGPVKYQACKFVSAGGPVGSCVAQIATDVSPTFCH